MRGFDREITDNLNKVQKSRTKADQHNELAEAEKSIGLFVLKNTETFEPTEETRINVKNAQLKLLLVEKFAHTASRTFNNAVEKLRGEKRELAKKIETLDRELRELHAKLGQNYQPFKVNFDPDVEEPELKIRVSEAEVLEHIRETDPSFGLPTTTAAEAVPETTHLVPFPAFALEERPKRLTCKDSTFNADRRELQNATNRYRVALLQREIQASMQKFDQAVEMVKEERSKLEFELKLAQMRALEFYRELLEVEAYEEEDEQLLEELRQKRQILRDLNERKTLNSCELEEKTLRESELQTELEGAVQNMKELVFPGDPVKAEFVYGWAKFNFRKNSAADGVVISEADELEYGNVVGDRKEWIQLTEQNEDWTDAIRKRLTSEENLAKAREERTASEAEKLKIDDKLKGAEKALKIVRDESFSFQRKKLERVNGLPHSFLLSADQVMVELPRVGEALLFAMPILEKLESRVHELEDEKEQIRLELAELLEAGAVLSKEMNLLRATNKIAQAELLESFRLKFGHPIELKLLDGLKSSKKTRDLRVELSELQRTGEKKVGEARDSLRKCKEELFAVKKQNTEVLRTISKLSMEELTLNKTLDTNNRQVLKEDNDSQRQDIVKRRVELRNVIDLLNGELDELKAEIVRLKSKSVGMT